MINKEETIREALVEFTTMYAKKYCEEHLDQPLDDVNDAGELIIHYKSQGLFDVWYDDLERACGFLYQDRAPYTADILREIVKAEAERLWKPMEKHSVWDCVTCGSHNIRIPMLVDPNTYEFHEFVPEPVDPKNGLFKGHCEDCGTYGTVRRQDAPGPPKISVRHCESIHEVPKPRSAIVAIWDDGTAQIRKVWHMSIDEDRTGVQYQFDPWDVKSRDDVMKFLEDECGFEPSNPDNILDKEECCDFNASGSINKADTGWAADERK